MAEKRRPAAPEAGSTPDLRSPAEGAASLVLKQVKARGSWRDDVPGTTRERGIRRAPSKLHDIKDFPTEGVFLIDVTTLLEDTPALGYGGGVAGLPSSRSPSRPRLWPAGYGRPERRSET